MDEYDELHYCLRMVPVWLCPDTALPRYGFAPGTALPRYGHGTRPIMLFSAPGHRVYG